MYIYRQNVGYIYIFIHEELTQKQQKNFIVYKNDLFPFKIQTNKVSYFVELKIIDFLIRINMLLNYGKEKKKEKYLILDSFIFGTS